MSTIYLLAALGAFALFLLTSVLSIALMAVWPVLALAFFLLAVSTGHLLVALEILKSLRGLIRGWFSYAGGLLAIIFGPLFQSEAKERFGYDWRRLPQVWAFTEGISKATGVRMVDDILITEEANCGVTETGGIFFGKRRHLVLGLPLIYVLTLPELESVIAHEFGHFKGNHPLARRLVLRVLEALLPVHELASQSRFFLISPLYWSTWISLAIFESIYTPWKHENEYDADRLAAQTAGSNHAIAGLRKARDEFPAAELAAILVIQESRRQGAGPTHLFEAAGRLAFHMNPREKKRLAGKVRGNPLEERFGQHPATEKRIAALHGIPQKSSPNAQIAAASFPDAREVEQSLSRQALPHLNQFVSPRAFVESMLANEAEVSAG